MTHRKETTRRPFALFVCRLCGFRGWRYTDEPAPVCCEQIMEKQERKKPSRGRRRHDSREPH